MISVRVNQMRWPQSAGDGRMFRMKHLLNWYLLRDPKPLVGERGNRVGGWTVPFDPLDRLWWTLPVKAVTRMIESVPHPVSPSNDPKIQNNTSEEITVEQIRDDITDLRILFITQAKPPFFVVTQST